jgi:hypothetical protein
MASASQKAAQTRQRLPRLWIAAMVIALAS